MSEYQYYEFQAIDRMLTEAEIAELRSFSTRAQITPTSFINEYNWGNFGGDINAWMEKYFDAFLYLANWGTHILSLRLPSRLLDLATASPYCEESVSAREKNGKTILTFAYQPEDGGGEYEEADGNLASLISVRSDLACGDLRCLYLGWLIDVQSGELLDSDLEPLVPAGLGQLNASLDSFAEFLRIDPDLIAAAAETSPKLVEMTPSPAETRAWLTGLLTTEKDDLLARIMDGEGQVIGSELVQRMRRQRATAYGQAPPAAAPRSVAELRRRTEEVSVERRRKAAAEAARRKAERERAAAHARALHLDQLAGKEPALWASVMSLVATMKPKSYEQAVSLLTDLRDLAARNNEAGFPVRMEALRAAHSGKRAFIGRLDEAGL